MGTDETVRDPSSGWTSQVPWALWSMVAVVLLVLQMVRHLVDPGWRTVAGNVLGLVLFALFFLPIRAMDAGTWSADQRLASFPAARF